ncbi:Fungal transcriptional regulatory protein [Cordyceps militaris CM01]|uniref:Fungal transcriptional regulatory protein n=1 Tax=Cordyceps militaris (strain CM01) TaxID=983644 RepID=G3JSY2_CORMM|nr:Fungal transcriptional regulatory protein [Cordyceps militaris CM01]EGX88978.1 Fungal transcriptional regulatory protein [Cordyceps militaris CM01]
MPVRRNTPLEKRRVKTGCVACRQRRRKCDEKKPQCTGCESRKVACKYVNGSDPQSGTYAEIIFVTNDPSPEKAAPSSETRGTAFARHSPRPSVCWQLPASSSSRTLTHHHHTTRSDWESYFDIELTEASQRDIALLRQFRYRTAPWLEAGDPDSAFGVAMMQTAQKCEPVQTLLVELASSHLRGDYNITRAHTARTELSDVAPELQPLADALIKLAETLCSGTRAWKRFVFQQGTHCSFQEPFKTLVCQQSRIDLAASILTCAPPMTTPDLYLLQHNATSRDHLILASPYNWALHHLTATLHFVFRRSADDLETARGSPDNPAAFSISGAPPNWQSLWLRSQAWYDTRPVEIQSLVDVGSIEVSRIDPTNAASFPIHLYSSAIAVQAAIFYHITALLLLQYKPRLLNIPGRRQHSTSPIWHARAIAGIVTSNDFPEQWDPIVISSILYTARDITHFAQQHAILACLQNITWQTGIPFDHEAEQLRAQWAAANLVESPPFR